MMKEIYWEHVDISKKHEMYINPALVSFSSACDHFLHKSRQTILKIAREMWIISQRYRPYGKMVAIKVFFGS